MSTLRVGAIQTATGQNALTLANNGVITPAKPIIANLYMSTAFHDFTEQSWHRCRFDSSDIDTYGNVANTTSHRFDIPVAGYYEVYCQIYFGATGTEANVRDTAMIITRTPSGGSEEVISSVHHRHYNAGSGEQDTSDVSETTHTIVNCAVGDQIIFRHNCNTDNSQAYDTYAFIGEDENSHIRYPASASVANNIAGRATHAWIKRIA